MIGVIARPLILNPWLTLLAAMLLLPLGAPAQRVNPAKFQTTTADSVYSSSETPIRNGSAATNALRLPIIRENPSVFFRLVSP
jgi:hypothetical protein